MSETPEQARDGLGLPADMTVARSAPDAGERADELQGLRAPEQETRSDEAMQMLREIVETVVLALVMFLIIRQGIQNYRIESHSMQPNFYEGQFVLVNKLAYRLGEPQRGDVVVFHNPANPKEDYIKRIVGLPGDTIDFRDGIAYVNGLPLDEPYVNPPTRGAISGDLTVVPDDHLFVMGDNRPNSRDSRAFGVLEQDLVVGKAWVRVWPVSEWGRVGHIDLIPGQPSTVEAAQ
jgi:signal peptidase I